MLFLIQFYVLEENYSGRSFNSCSIGVPQLSHGITFNSNFPELFTNIKSPIMVLLTPQLQDATMIGYRMY